jgi:hypothetical protein
MVADWPSRKRYDQRYRKRRAVDRCARRPGAVRRAHAASRIHFCLGPGLARVELQIAITTLMQRVPYLRLAVPPETLQWQTVPVFRGLKALPVAF